MRIFFIENYISYESLIFCFFAGQTSISGWELTSLADFEPEIEFGLFSLFWLVSLGDSLLGDSSVGAFSLGDSSLGAFSLGDSSLGDSSLGAFSLGDSSLGDSSIGDSSIGDSTLVGFLGDSSIPL